MAIVVNIAFPAAKLSPGGEVNVAQSIADPHVETFRTKGAAPTPVSGLPATDCNGGIDHTVATSTSTDWDIAGTDIDR